MQCPTSALFGFLPLVRKNRRNPFHQMFLPLPNLIHVYTVHTRKLRKSLSLFNRLQCYSRPVGSGSSCYKPHHDSYVSCPSCLLLFYVPADHFTTKFLCADFGEYYIEWSHQSISSTNNIKKNFNFLCVITHSENICMGGGKPHWFKPLNDCL